MKKFVAATLFCATIAIPAVAQGPNAKFAVQAPASAELTANRAADLVPVPGAVAAPVGASGLYGGDMAAPKESALSLPAGPAPSLAWIFALGFLGLIILRRTRSSTAF